MVRRIRNILISSLLLATMTSSCRTDDEGIVGHQEVTVGEPTEAIAVEGRRPVVGFYLLNEGNMGSNKATLDYYDMTTGKYLRNIYAEANPGVVQEMGDVGNDLQTYGNRLYAVINCSHFVEVMDVRTARHIGQVSIPNCRYVVFSGGYAYVSSYAGPVQIDPNSRRGYVAKVDTASLQVVDSCVVGYQPDEMIVRGNRLYVANSGGYRIGNYDRTISVIDLNTFKVVNTIDVGVNLHRMEVDSWGYLWVSSRGDYFGTKSKTYVVDTRTEQLCDSLDLPCSEMTMQGDSLYVCSSEFSYLSQSNAVSYAIIDTRTRKIVTRQFIADGTEQKIAVPYGLAVNPDNGDIYVTDAGDYVSPGQLYCFTREGRLRWQVRTGDIPAHFAFTYIPLKY